MVSVLGKVKASMPTPSSRKRSCRRRAAVVYKRTALAPKPILACHTPCKLPNRRFRRDAFENTLRRQEDLFLRFKAPRLWPVGNHQLGTSRLAVVAGCHTSLVVAVLPRTPWCAPHTATPAASWVSHRSPQKSKWIFLTLKCRAQHVPSLLCEKQTSHAPLDAIV